MPQRWFLFRSQWKVPALTWAVICLLVQWPALQNRSFEPDEGLRVYCGRQLLQGQTPYRDFWDHKDPTEWFLCGLLLTLFGNSLTGLRLGVNVLRALLIYHLVALGHQSRMTKNLWLLGGLAFALLTSETIQGNTAAMEVPGLLLFLVAMRLALASGAAPPLPRHVLLLASGVCSGLGLLIKTPAAVACLPPLLFLLVIATQSTPPRPKTRLLTDSIALMSGLLVPVALVACWCLQRGILHEWLFVLTVYNPAYSESLPHWDYLAGVLPSRLWFLFPFAVLSVSALSPKDRCKPRLRVWMGAWLVCASLAVCVGWRFYPHYFLLLAPPLALAGAAAWPLPWKQETLSSMLRVALTTLFLLVVILHSANAVKWYLLDAPHWRPPPFGFFTNQSILDLAARIKKNTRPHDSIYVLGYCPDIYVLSQRRSASRFFFKYPLAAEHSPIRKEARREVLHSLRTTPPRYIVVMKKDWTPQHPLDSDRFVNAWQEMKDFLNNNYRLVESQKLFDLYRRVS